MSEQGPATADPATNEAAPATEAMPTAEVAFDYDVHAALAHLRKADAKLAAMIERVGPFAMRRDQAPTLFLALAEAIVFQQLNGRAAATIWGRVKALFPREPEGPSAASLLGMSDEKLRGAGLSANKLLSLRDLARRTQAGELPSLSEAEALSDEVLIERLTEVRGIGRWTVEMLLMFRLGRPDILAVDDFGIRKGFAVTLGKRTMPERTQVAKHGQRWAPYRSVASWYLWRAAALADAKLSSKPKAANKPARKKSAKKKGRAKKARAKTRTVKKARGRSRSAPARSRAARA
jgi:3-methyladenine DNA glycosylase/8-oxoguanine DNA glycosylase